MPSNYFNDQELKKKYDYLAPDGSEIRLLPEVSGGGLAHCTLPVGGISKAVKHRTVEEIWFFLSGKGQVWRKLDNTEIVVNVSAGYCLTIPVGTHFQFRNTVNELLQFIIANTPRWPGPYEAVPVNDKWQSKDSN